GVVPQEKRLSFLVDLIDETERMFGDLFVDCFHALHGERSGVLDLLSALAVSPAVQHAAGAKSLPELRVAWIVGVLRLLLGIEVVEVAEKLVEAMRCGEKLVLVAQMVLAELAGGVAQRLQQFGDGWILRPNSDIGPGHPDLCQAGADWVLPGDERSPAGGTTLLAVIVGEGRTLMSDPSNVGGSVAHMAPCVI